MNPYIQAHLKKKSEDQDTIPVENLVLYQRFHNSLVDETGNHTPIGNGISYDTGIYSNNPNESILFNSDSDYVLIPDSDLLSFGNGVSDFPFSISFVLSMNTRAIDFNWLFDKRSTTTGGADKEYSVLVNSQGTQSGEVFFILRDQSSGGTITAESSMSLNQGNKYHGVLTYSGIGNESGLNIYLQGALDPSTKSKAGNYTAMENLGAPLQMSGLRHANNYQIDGRLSGVGIWNIELSPADVLAIFNKQSAGIDLL